jgi:hypothetical protein
VWKPLLLRRRRLTAGRNRPERPFLARRPKFDRFRRHAAIGIGGSLHHHVRTDSKIVHRPSGGRVDGRRSGGEHYFRTASGNAYGDARIIFGKDRAHSYAAKRRASAASCSALELDISLSALQGERRTAPAELGLSAPFAVLHAAEKETDRNHYRHDSDNYFIFHDFNLIFNLQFSISNEFSIFNVSNI